MDLTSWLLGQTPPRLLVVAVPGGTAERLAVERVARVRGWRMAANPAEANMLVITGSAGAGFAPFVDAVWRSVPVPRVSVQVSSASRAEETLVAAVADLRDLDRQRSEAARLAEVAKPEKSTAADSEHHEHVPHDHDMHEMSGSHHGHDMGGMELPGGIPMADRAPDRDGLMLDRLRVPLGPILPDWPAGLVIHTGLQGDVIQEATVEVVGSSEEIGPAFWRVDGPDTALRTRGRWLDSCARLLMVAGWEHAAVRARLLRDDVLLGQSDQRVVERWARRVRRSRVLRWSLTGIGVLSGADWDGTVFAGDAYDRLVRWLALAVAADREEPNLGQAVGEILPSLMVGSELAGARLVVASLDPDTEVLAGAVTADG